MAANEERPLTKAEIEEIHACEKIVKWAEDILHGRHPTIKIPAHHRPEVQPCPKPFPDNLRIDFRRHYYKDLGVQSDDEVTAIEKAFRSRWGIWSPVSEEGQRKWTDRNPAVRALAEKGWDQVCMAHKILTTPALRSKYDAGRICTAEELIKAASDKANFAEQKKRREMREKENKLKTALQSQNDKVMAGMTEKEDDNSRCVPLPTTPANTLPKEGATAEDDVSATDMIYPQGAGPNNPIPDYFPDHKLKINLEVNYYSILGVTNHATTKGIHQAFVSRWHKYSPHSLEANEKWLDENVTKRRKVANDWHSICKAHQILTNPKLRGEYDSQRLVYLREKHAEEKELTAELKGKTHAMQKMIMAVKTKELEDKRKEVLDEAGKLRKKIEDRKALQKKGVRDRGVAA